MSALAALFAALALGGAQEAEAANGDDAAEPAECAVWFSLSNHRARNVRIDCGEHDGDAALRAEAERQMNLFRFRPMRDGERRPTPVRLLFDRLDDGWRARLAPVMSMEPRYPGHAVAGGHSAVCVSEFQVREGRTRNICVTCAAVRRHGEFEAAMRHAIEGWTYTHADDDRRVRNRMDFSPFEGAPLPEAPPYPACPEAG
ncbi:MAG: hypothetical protein KIS81_08140 [Maricaulaceae bacterium]|nr:hypothetical protein [Maricaulaceae bacterium]